MLFFVLYFLSIKESQFWICFLFAYRIYHFDYELPVSFFHDITGQIIFSTFINCIFTVNAYFIFLDIKPSNMLMEENGYDFRVIFCLWDIIFKVDLNWKSERILFIDPNRQVKLCDFGIAGRLVDSKAKTRGAGCAAYMAVWLFSYYCEIHPSHLWHSSILPKGILQI